MNTNKKEYDYIKENFGVNNGFEEEIIIEEDAPIEEKNPIESADIKTKEDRVFYSPLVKSIELGAHEFSRLYA